MPRIKKERIDNNLSAYQVNELERAGVVFCDPKIVWYGHRRGTLIGHERKNPIVAFDNKDSGYYGGGIWQLSEYTTLHSSKPVFDF